MTVLSVLVSVFWSTAMIFASVDEYAQTESRYRIALLGERVELDCFGNTSRPLEWYFTLYGSNESEFINGSSQTDDANVTDAYRIVNDDLGHSTLIIGNVLLTHAGRYECRDVDNDYKLFVEVTVLGKDILHMCYKTNSLFFFVETAMTVIIMMKNDG